MLRKCMLGVLVTVSVTAGAQPAGAARYRIGTSQVAATLARAGMDVMARQVHLEADVWSRSANPEMDMVSAQALPDRKHAWVRIDCHDPRECRSFYATISWSGPLPPARDVTAPKARVTSYTPPAMRMGDHATLVVDGPQLHMEIEVIAMQNGAVGQVIQLATPDRKRFYRGQVVNKFTLTGTL